MLMTLSLDSGALTMWVLARPVRSFLAIWKIFLRWFMLLFTMSIPGLLLTVLRKVRPSVVVSAMGLFTARF